MISSHQHLTNKVNGLIKSLKHLQELSSKCENMRDIIGLLKQVRNINRATCKLGNWLINEANKHAGYELFKTK